MRWGEFWQIVILFSLFMGGLVYAILILHKAELDTFFLISFILAVFTITLSIYYSERTNIIFNQITEKLQSLQDETKTLYGDVSKLANENQNNPSKEKINKIAKNQEKINKKLDMKIKEYGKKNN
ncbi:MAG: hypothetical protein ACFFG0_03180 [Candidatus Thorarchaeota archaeon]